MSTHPRKQAYNRSKLTVALESTLVNQSFYWFLLVLLTGVWVRDYFQNQDDSEAAASSASPLQHRWWLLKGLPWSFLHLGIAPMLLSRSEKAWWLRWLSWVVSSPAVVHCFYHSGGSLWRLVQMSAFLDIQSLLNSQVSWSPFSFHGRFQFRRNCNITARGGPTCMWRSEYRQTQV